MSFGKIYNVHIFILKTTILIYAILHIFSRHILLCSLVICLFVVFFLFPSVCLSLSFSLFLFILSFNIHPSIKFAMQSNDTFVLYNVQQGHIQITLTTNNSARIYAYDIHAQQFTVQDEKKLYHCKLHSYDFKAFLRAKYSNNINRKYVSLLHCELVYGF